MAFNSLSFFFIYEFSETGGLTTRHNRRIKSHQVIEEDNLSQSNVTPITSEMISPTTPQGEMKQLIFKFE